MMNLEMSSLELLQKFKSLSKEKQDQINLISNVYLAKFRQEQKQLDKIFLFNLVALLTALTIGVVVSTKWVLLAWFAAPLSWFSGFLYHSKNINNLRSEWVSQINTLFESEKTVATTDEPPPHL